MKLLAHRYLLPPVSLDLLVRLDDLHYQICFLEKGIVHFGLLELLHEDGEMFLAGDAFLLHEVYVPEVTLEG